MKTTQEDGPKSLQRAPRNIPDLKSKIVSQKVTLNSKLVSRNKKKGL